MNIVKRYIDGYGVRVGFSYMKNLLNQNQINIFTQNKEYSAFEIFTKLNEKKK